MTDDGDRQVRLAAIRERVEAATPGPWTTPGPDTVGQWMVYDGEWCVAEVHNYGDEDRPFSAKPGARGPKYIDGDANAAFIAHAREDIPFLLELLELSGIDAWVADDDSGRGVSR